MEFEVYAVLLRNIFWYWILSSTVTAVVLGVKTRTEESDKDWPLWAVIPMSLLIGWAIFPIIIAILAWICIVIPLAYVYLTVESFMGDLFTKKE